VCSNIYHRVFGNNSDYAPLLPTTAGMQYQSIVLLVVRGLPITHPLQLNAIASPSKKLLPEAVPTD